jgi:hypothetical protein
VLERAKVSPREGDAQKALRRSYITSALVCDRNPKLVAAELGHATSHKVVSNYDSFLDPKNWPDVEETRQLRRIYGWEARRMAPLWHPPGAPRRRPITQLEIIGTPGGIRTPDPQVRSQPEQPETPPESTEDPSPSRTEPQ